MGLRFPPEAPLSPTDPSSSFAGSSAGLGSISGSPSDDGGVEVPEEGSETWRFDGLPPVVGSISLLLFSVVVNLS